MRCAPSAKRTDISRARAVERASSRLATFPHPISSTEITANNSKINGTLKLPETHSREANRRSADAAILVQGIPLQAAAVWRSSAFACSNKTPFYSRPISCIGMKSTEVLFLCKIKRQLEPIDRCFLGRRYLNPRPALQLRCKACHLGESCGPIHRVRRNGSTKMPGSGWPHFPAPLGCLPHRSFARVRP